MLPLILIGATRADETTAAWPHVRGPSFDGTSDAKDLADGWPAEGPPVLWIREIGRGYSGFVAADGRVFTQGQTLLGQYVYCLDAETGETLWRHRFGPPYEHAGMYPGPRATPTYHEGSIYFAGPRGWVGRLEAHSGQLRWALNVNKAFTGRGTEFGYSCAPFVYAGRLILPVGGRAAGVVALDVEDGATAWTSGGYPASYCGVVPITLDHHDYLVAFLQNDLIVIDASSGDIVWDYALSRGYDEHAALPLYQEPHLVISGPFRAGAKMFRLSRPEAQSELRSELIWDVADLSNDTASSIIVDGHLYGFDLRDMQAKAHRASRGMFKCLDLATGDVRWATEDPGHATVLAADGKLLLFNDQGELQMARLSAEGYQPLARTRIFRGEICWTPPALYDGRLYVRSPQRAACVLLRSPEHLNTRERAATPASQTRQPAHYDLTQLVGGEREYPFDPPDYDELKAWYLWSLAAVFLPAWCIALLGRWTLNRSGSTRSRSTSRAVFWGVAFALGILATPVGNRFAQQFLFTWPASLYIVVQAQILVTLRERQLGRPRRRQWASLCGVLVLMTSVVAYFLACRTLGMAMQWIYISGLMIGVVVAIPTGYLLTSRGGGLGRDVLGAIITFSVYFWASSWLLEWLVR